MTELRLLSEQLGVSERTLRRAVNEGALRATRPSPRTLHMSFAERRYTRRAWPILAALRNALRTERNVRLAVLFGSLARGSEKMTSDVDVLVEMADSNLDRVVDLKSKLAEVTGRRIDIVRREDAETEPALWSVIASEGRVLVDRDNRWPDLVRGAAHVQDGARRRQQTRTRAALAGIDRMLGI
jgi:predicted nucleotidyltransferase